MWYTKVTGKRAPPMDDVLSEDASLVPALEDQDAAMVEELPEPADAARGNQHHEARSHQMNHAERCVLWVYACESRRGFHLPARGHLFIES